MLSVDELQRTIADSNPGDWQRWETEWGLIHEGEGVGLVAVYQPDPRLRVVRGRKQVGNFREEWSERYPDTENNESYSFWVMFNQSPIDYVVLVAVDGYRAYVGVPDRPESPDDPWTISKYQYVIGAAVSHHFQTYEERLEIGGIEVN